MSTIAVDARGLRTSTGRYVERMLHYLQQIDHSNTYIVLIKSADIDGWQPINSHFTKLACPHKEYTFDEQLGFKKQLDKLGADLVHFPMVQQPVWYSGKTVTTMQDLTTIRFRNPAKNPVIFTLKQQIYKWVNKRVAKKADALITPTQFVKDDVVRFTGINPDKVTVTYEAADPIKEPPSEMSELAGRPFIMYVGRPTPHKNLERLIEAFGSLQDKHPNLTLVLVGKKDANYERIEANVRKQNIANVLFTGFASEGQLRWLYEHCEAYVFPSLSEGFGLPPLEAMEHGAPVVSSNATCLPELYGDAVHYFDPLDTRAIAKAIDEVLSNQTLRKTLINAGRRQVQKYSWRRMAEQTLAVYQAVLDE